MPGMMSGMMPGMVPSCMPGMMPMPSMMPMGMMPGMMPIMMPGMPPQPHPGSGTNPLGTAAEVGAQQEPKQPEQPEPPLDPEVRQLCEHFEIEAHCARLLNQEMDKRQDSKASDLARLWELLEDVGSPTCLLALKIEEMKNGEFRGKILQDREVEALALNFDLGSRATSKLNEVVSRRATRKGEDLVRMERILEYSREPGPTATLVAERLLDGRYTSIPDLGEAEDVMRKFSLDEDAKKRLVEIVLERADDSSAVLGALELHLEASKQASETLRAVSGRLLAGKDLPDEPWDDRRPSFRADGDHDRERDRHQDRERGRERDRERDRDRDERERDRSRERERERRRRSRSRGRPRR